MRRRGLMARERGQTPGQIFRYGAHQFGEGLARSAPHLRAMARRPRYHPIGQPQHVVQRGNNRGAMFVEDDDYYFFRTLLVSACEEFECRVHAYVFMPNHMHLLMSPFSTSGIGKVMQSVGRRYVPRFNSMRGRTGGLWEGRYRAMPIDSERYLLTCYRYIELNPVVARLVEDPLTYPWSSFGANAFGREDRLVTAHETYLELALDDEQRYAAYRALFEPESDGVARPHGTRMGSDPG
jgi:putative transposase